MSTSFSRKRRQALTRGVALAGSVLFFSAGLHRAAAQKSSKASLAYQDHPHEGKQCGNCKYFSPGGDTGGAGTCALVDGPIQPAGWCLAFSPRQ